MSHKKFRPDRFSRFDVYWVQTNKQTPKQTDKPNLYIDKMKYFPTDIFNFLGRSVFWEMQNLFPIGIDRIHNIFKTLSKLFNQTLCRKYLIKC